MKQYDLLGEESHLELSFAKMRRDLLVQGADAEEMRSSMGNWQISNREMIDRVYEQRSTRESQRIQDAAVVQIPNGPPSLGSLTDEDFLQSARDYLGSAQAAFYGKVESIEAAEEARRKLGAWGEQPENKRLMAEMNLAENRILDRDDPVYPPLSADELNQLGPEERIHQEIYAAIFEVMLREPARSAEEFRDRLGEVHEYVEAKQSELGQFQDQRILQEAQKRVDVLTDERNSLEKNEP